MAEETLETPRKCLDNLVLPFNLNDSLNVTNCLVMLQRIKPQFSKPYVCKTKCRNFPCEYHISFAYDLYCSNPLIVAQARDQGAFTKK